MTQETLRRGGNRRKRSPSRDAVDFTTCCAIHRRSDARSR